MLVSSKYSITIGATEWVKRFRRRIVDLRKIVRRPERRLGAQPIDDLPQCALRLRLDDQPVAFFAHDRVFSREFELPRNAHCLIAAVAEELDMTFGTHAISVAYAMAYVNIDDTVQRHACPLTQRPLRTSKR